MLAVILAGGKGTRLKPYTYVLPKPLVPVGEKPILSILVNQLKRYGITDLVFCVNHMAELIMAYFGNGHSMGVNIRYSMEDKPMGTIGPLKLIENLPENFLLMNGDLLTDLSFSEIYNTHLQRQSLITVGTYHRQVDIDFGVMEISENRVTGFIEKPRYGYQVSMGIYVFNKRVLDFVPDQQFFGFDDLMLSLLAKNEPIDTFPFNGYWLDIGRLEDFEKANQDIEKIKFF